MIPTQVRRFRVDRAPSDARWLEALLNREGKPFHAGVELQHRKFSDTALGLADTIGFLPIGRPLDFFGPFE